MDADEIIALTPATVGRLIKAHQGAQGPLAATGMRRAPRWLFAGTTQLWLKDGTGPERLVFGTCCNLSTSGLGLRTEEALAIGATIPVAIHLPDASYHGRAVVRHCTARPRGFYVGMEFCFE